MIGLSRPAAIHLPRGDGDQQIDSRGEPHRPTRAEQLEQPERSDHAAGDGADRVERVERRDVLAARVAGACDRARRGGQRAAHRECRHGENQRAENETTDRRDRHAEAGGAAAGDVDGPHEREQERAHRRADRDRRFEIGVEEKRTRLAIRARTEQQAADAEAADENREHGGRRRRRRTEDQPEFTEPADLIDQRAESGAEKQQTDRPGARAHVPDTYRSLL